MGQRLIMGCVAVFMLATVICCISSGRWLLNGEINIFNALASFNMMSVQAGGVWQAPKTVGDYWNGLVTAFTWNYPFLESAWCIFIKIPLWVASCGTIWAIIQVFAPIIQGFVSMVRYLIPGV